MKTDALTKTYAVLTLAILGVYACVCFAIISARTYMPCWSDECVYFLNALSFAQNNSLNDAVIQNNTTSAVGQFGPHGFMCTLIDGAWLKLFGAQARNIIALNCALLLSALAIILTRWKLPLASRFILCFATLAPAYTFLYLGTCMQETLNLAVAAVLTTLLSEFYCHPEKRKAASFWFAVVLTLAALIRPHWLLLLIAFLPMAVGRRSFFQLLAVFLSGAALMLALFELFFTTYPDGFLFALSKYLAVHDFETGGKFFVQHLLNTSRQFFIGNDSDLFTNLYKMLYVSLSIYLSVIWCKSRDAFAGGAALFSWLTLALLLCAYDCLYFREVRFLGPLMPLLLSTSLLRGPSKGRAFVTVGSLLVMLACFGCAKLFFDEHVKAGQTYAASGRLVNNLEHLRDLVGRSNDVTINLPLSVFADNIWALASYPVRSSSGHRIRYSVAFDRPHLLSTKSASHFVLLPQAVAASPTELAGLQPLEINETYSLFAGL